MFLRYLDFIFAPFRAINNKILGVKNIKGNIQVDINRAKSLKQRGQNFAASANKVNQQAQGYGQQQQQPGQQPVQGQPQQQQGGYYMQQPGIPGQAPGAPGMPGMPGAPGAPGLPMANPPIRTTGWWIFKKKFCSQ